MRKNIPSHPDRQSISENIQKVDEKLMTLRAVDCKKLYLANDNYVVEPADEFGSLKTIHRTQLRVSFYSAECGIFT